jgi:hypothetical protein
LPNHYTHAKDIPFENWANLHEIEKDNYNLLAKDGVGCPHCSQIAYAKIQRSLVEVFGYGDSYIKVIKAKAKLEMFELKFAITQDRFWLTEIELSRIELEKLTSGQSKDYSYWNQFHDLSEALGVTLDAKKETLLGVQQKTLRLAKRSEAQRTDEKAKAGVYGNGQQNYRNR